LIFNVTQETHTCPSMLKACAFSIGYTRVGIGNEFVK
jgi:hypothetical protein